IAKIFAVGAEKSVLYTCNVDGENNELLTIEFLIPKDEHTFEDDIPAHLLCRWIKSVEFN
ncbi:MAG: hypothetical protein ACKO96_01460, partial [Flammeovirgaceae bacterium]